MPNHIFTIVLDVTLRVSVPEIRAGAMLAIGGLS